MRVQVGQHAGDCAVDQLLVVDGFDVAALDRGEYAGELAEFFEGQRATRVALGDGGQANADQDTCHDAHADQANTANFTFAAHVFLRGYDRNDPQLDIRLACGFGWRLKMMDTATRRADDRIIRFLRANAMRSI